MLVGVGDMTLKTTLTDVSIQAFSGTYDDSSNSLGGSVTVDGTPVALSGMLDPNFSRQAFDDGDRCPRNLQAVVPTRFP